MRGASVLMSLWDPRALFSGVAPKVLIQPTFGTEFGLLEQATRNQQKGRSE